MTALDAVVYDAAELVVGSVEDRPQGRPHGPEAILERYEDGALAIVDGDVAAVGPTEAVTAEYPPENAATAIDTTGQTVLPGFVDPHTHAVFAGDRSDEYAAKLRGKTYQEILAEGGGILRTVAAVRDASEETLVANLRAQLDVMLAHGTTTAEVKSGYGLDVDTEEKLLAAIDTARRDHPVDVVPTFLGAHAVPEDSDADEYVDHVVDDQLPAVADQGIAEFCDVFCDAGAFSVEQSRRVLEAGLDYGLAPKVHADEFERLGASQLAADVDATSADHLLKSTPEDLGALLEAGVTPVLLPGTAFGLGGEYADARTILDRGGPAALATDFNPNCHTRSMSFAIALACTGMAMTPAEALIGATHAGAQAIDRTDGVGTLRVGAPGDVIVVDGPTHVHIPYTPGENLVTTVLKGGDPVHG
ncbi:MAG: imidazolonepropionase [Halobacteriaceae archaeon]